VTKAFTLASSFICVFGEVSGYITRAAATVIKYIEWAESV